MRRIDTTRRLGGTLVVAGIVAVAAASCSDAGETLETLPPIRTTTTTTTTTTPPTTRPDTYQIQPGESLYSVADRFGVTIGQLATLNSIANVDYVQAGEVIELPPAGRSPTSGPPGS